MRPVAALRTYCAVNLKKGASGLSHYSCWTRQKVKPHRLLTRDAGRCRPPVKGLLDTRVTDSYGLDDIDSNADPGANFLETRAPFIELDITVRARKAIMRGTPVIPPPMTATVEDLEEAMTLFVRFTKCVLKESPVWVQATVIPKAHGSVSTQIYIVSTILRLSDFQGRGLQIPRINV